ncbi:MAG TPA: hypothetical protein VN803_02255, partial [Gemmatimonadales bacterium]|nr:hypothetical protein [Gemmatimonadales bacterium]
MRSVAFVSVLVIAVITSRPAAGQSRIGLELMNSYYRGSAVDTSGNPHVRPGNALMPTLRLDTRINSVRVALRMSYSKPGLSLTGQGVTITDRSSDKLYEATGTVGFHVGGIGSSGAIVMEVGPTLHVWKATPETRTRVGGLVAGSYEWPVSERFSGAIRTEGILSKSWFDETDLPPEYRRQAT